MYSEAAMVVDSSESESAGETEQSKYLGVYIKFKLNHIIFNFSVPLLSNSDKGKQRAIDNQGFYLLYNEYTHIIKD